MSDTIHTTNKPDLYIQEIIKHPDGKTEFKDIAATWDKANYSSGTLDKDRKIIVRTREQRDALFAMREQQKQAQEQVQEQSQSVQSEQTQTPQL